MGTSGRKGFGRTWTRSKGNSFGQGAHERSRAGFFAANNFFDANPNHPDSGWFTTAQIKVPEQSMYLVDSFYGEIIQDEPGPFDRMPPTLGDDDPP